MKAIRLSRGGPKAFSYEERLSRIPKKTRCWSASMPRPSRPPN